MQYRARRRPYLLVWCIALTIFALVTLAEVLGAAGGWSTGLYRTYYFLSAVLLVGVLALGTVHLLAPRAVGITQAALLVLGGAGLIGVLGAQLETGLLASRQVPRALPATGSLFNLVAVLAAILVNLSGTVVLVGGALWSAYGLWRRGHPPQRVIANVLIAAGALIVAFATGLVRLGVYELFYVGQAVGVAVMFLGFLVAQRQPARAAPIRPVPARRGP